MEKEDNGVRRSFRKRSISIFHMVSQLVLQTTTVTGLTHAGSIIKDRKGDQGELESTVKLADKTNTFLSQTTAAIFISQQTFSLTLK